MYNEKHISVSLDGWPTQLLQRGTSTKPTREQESAQTVHWAEHRHPRGNLTLPCRTSQGAFHDLGVRWCTNLRAIFQRHSGQCRQRVVQRLHALARTIEYQLDCLFAD